MAVGLPCTPGTAIFEAMTDRRYTDEEVAAIFSAAAEEPGTRPALTSQQEGLTLADLQALLEPTAPGHRLRVRTLKGDARASMSAGLFAVGMSAVVAVAAALAGQLGHAVPGVAFLALAGLGLFANGALRVPGWAR